ncbi:uncharacterized protein LOC131313233 isoform X2 [Rhododendron vialii]|uniref:uncharacterized protein LOC131313233 isoform X2 n=1 Tax=Rhododendron vialii TaxID=182163 RepID=UPI00265F0D40|nr:uncharacterized protein LOC131313233 isoform X2 [Rhododendron vialii]
MEEMMNQNPHPHPLEGPGPGGSSSTDSSIGLEYWVQWQVLVCALILILPSVVAVRILKRELHRHPPLITSTSSSDLWLPCWTNLHPLWLLFFRAFAFASMSFILCRVVIVLGGPFAFYFYTQWTFALVTLYFALATVVSARGCWRYSKNSFLGDKGESTKGATKFQSRYTQQEVTEWKADFLEQLLQAVYQTCAGASMLADVVFWCLLLPFLLGDKFQLTLLIGSIHSVNAIFLMLDSALNSQPFSWYGLAYFVLWSVSYVVFQWILHACGFTWWPYPFLELSTPSAPLWYLALGLVHLPCYGIYVLLVKAKGSIFSGIFPYAFARS